MATDGTKEIYTLTESEIKSLKIPRGSRSVIIKITQKTTEETTPSGIIKIADTDYEPARHSDRSGIVIAAPRDPLPFKQLVPGQDLDEKMPWKTHVQISKGMRVWFDFMASENCVTYIDEMGYDYKVILYEDCFLATLPFDAANNLPSTADGTSNIIPLNGFHLYERIYKEQTGNFDIFEKHKVDRTRAIVKYVAKNNEAYELSSDEDPFELQVGDEVKFNNVPEVMLEDEAHCHFDSSTMYRRAQARNISLVYRNGELILPKGRVLLKTVPNEEVTPGGIILPKEEIKNQKGDILLSAIDEIKEGSRVIYIKGAGIPYEHEGQACRIIQEHQILFVE